MAAYMVQTKNTFLEVQTGEQVQTMIVPASAPTVYRTPADMGVPIPCSTPEMWVSVPQFGPDGTQPSCEGAPFPTLQLDETAYMQQLPPQPSEKMCMDAFRSALADCFRATSGVMFLASRDYPNCFTVRLRVPPNVELDEAARKVANKSSYPKTLHIVSTHVNSRVFTVDVNLFHIPKGRYNVCWDLIKSKTGECPRGPQCRWEHLAPVYISVNLEHHGAQPQGAGPQGSSSSSAPADAGSPARKPADPAEAGTPDTSASTPPGD